MSIGEINWLTWMTTIGFPKCEKKENFGINVTNSLEKDLNSIAKNDLIDMKLGTFIILCIAVLTKLQILTRLYN